MGSVDFIAAARTAQFIASDPNDSTRTAVIPFKSNIGPKGKSLGFLLYNDETLRYWTWTGISSLDEESAFEEREKKSKRNAVTDCAEWLRSLVLLGPSDVENIIKLGEVGGFGKSTIYEAKKKLDLSYSTQPSNGKGRGKAWWASPGFNWREYWYGGGHQEPVPQSDPKWDELDPFRDGDQGKLDPFGEA
jgi:hypothetical protein